MIARLEHSSMRPLSLAAAGILLVAIDFRARAADVAPDPVGWLLVALAAALLAAGVPACWALVAAVLSLSDVLLPYRIAAIDPATGVELRGSFPGGDASRALLWDDVSDVRALAMAGAVAAGATAVVTFASALADRATEAGAVRPSRWVWAGGTSVACVWAAPYVVVALVAVGGPERFDPVWEGAHGYMALAGIVVMLAFAGVLVSGREETWAVPAAAMRPSRWDGRLTGAPGGPAPTEGVRRGRSGGG